MPLRSSLHLKINGVNGDATADAFDGSFPVDGYDITAPTSPSGTPQTFSFDVHALKTSAAVSSDIASRDIVSSDIVSSDIASSAALSPASAAVPVPASSPLQYFVKIDGVTGDAPLECAFRQVLEAGVPLSAFGVAEGGGLRFQLSLWKDGLPVDAVPHAGWIELRPE